MSFARAYLDAVGVPGSPDLHAHLEAAWDQACATWASLAVEPERFAAHLVRCGLTDPAQLPASDMSDLYLACACLARVPGAAEALEASVMRDVPPAVARVRRGAEFTEEVLSELRIELLVGVRDKPPALERYRGRGPLRSFVLVMAMRRAVDRTRDPNLRRDQNAARDRNEEIPFDGTGADRQQIRRELKAPVERALKDALARLDPDMQEILRLHFVEGVSAQEIAKRRGVHRSTATRWINEAREAVFKDVQARLTSELQLAPGEFDSFARAFADGLDLTLNTFVRR
ncbi:MAG: sigma-70 family RNA polymerase sigma factor [Sandaracinaceae bacterium]